MITRKRLKLLNELLDSLNSKYRINEGGCCYVAYIIARNLKKLNIDFNIMFTDSEPLDIRNIHNNESVYHVYLHIPYIGDVNPMYSEYNKKFNLSIKELLVYYNNSIWNNTYNPEFNNCINKQINKFFKEL